MGELGIELNIVSLVTIKTNEAQEVAQARAEIKQLNVRFNALLVRINALSVSASDNEIISLYTEYEVLCKTQEGQVVRFKASGLLRHEEVKADLQEGMDKRLLIARKLIDLLKKIKDLALRSSAANKLAQSLVGAEKVMKEAGLAGRGNLTEITREFLEICQVLGLELDSTLSSQLAAIAQLNQKDRESSSFSKDELSFELLSMFQRYDSSRQIWELIAQWEKERNKLLEQAAEIKQKEKLEARRLEEKREGDRIYQRKVKKEKEVMDLAARATEFRKGVSLNYFDLVDAEVQHELIVLELCRLQKQEALS